MKNPSQEQVKRWNKAYYEKNKKQRREQYNKRNKELREWYHTLKSSLSCSNCGFSHPAALQFHHKDAANKLSDVSRLVSAAVSKNKILEEIDKCVVLCANCHAILHSNDNLS